MPLTASAIRARSSRRRRSLIENLISNWEARSFSIREVHFASAKISAAERVPLKMRSVSMLWP